MKISKLHTFAIQRDLFILMFIMRLLYISLSLPVEFMNKPGQLRRVVMSCVFEEAFPISRLF